MSIQESLRIVAKTKDIAYVEFDLIGEKVNKLSTPVMKRLEEICRDLKSSSFKVVVFISRKPKIFIAGADIEEIKGIRDLKEATLASAEGHRIFNLIEDLPIPVISAIHGACLGGGCELSLACDYRLASDDPSTKIGLPEVNLGIIPGFGGCVRLPRVIGLQAALDIILAGKSVDGKKAEKLGLVEKCVPAAIFEDEVFKLAQEVASHSKKRTKVFKAKGTMNVILETALGRQLVFKKAKDSALAATRGNYPAPLAALAVICKTYGMKNRAKAFEIEAQHFGKVAITDVSKNLIHIFFMTEGIKKQSGVANRDVKARPVGKLAVLGAGTMGGGIGQLAADKGIDTRMKDVNVEALSRGFQAAGRIWKKALERRKINKYEHQRRGGLLTGGTDFSGFGRMDVIVEAIVEDMEIKKKVIREAVEHSHPNVIVATNTSSLSVTTMSSGHPKPENFVGMHFFNPVDKMPLIEVIRGEKTSDEVTATIFELAKKMGKYPVVVKDGPGFLVNRLLLPYLNEAVYMLSEGFSVESIDDCFLKFGMPMGPLHLIDEIGIDVAVKVAKIFHKAFGERAEPSPLMLKVAESGRLGKKNGKGFYIYDESGKKLHVDSGIYAALGLSVPKGPVGSEECINRGIYAMVNEAALALLDDKIVERAEEVDLAMIMGTGFPPFRGGLLKYADGVGSVAIVDSLEDYARRIGPRFKPSTPLRNMARTNRLFY